MRGANVLGGTAAYVSLAARLLGVSKWKILRLIRKYDLNEAIRQQRGELEEPI